METRFNKKPSSRIKDPTDFNIGRISSIQTFNNRDLVLGSDNGVFKINNKEISNYFQRTSVKNLFVYNDTSLLVASDREVYNVSVNNLYHADTIWHGRATCACKINNEYYVGTLAGLNIDKR